jgi:hypothetical protein
MSDSSKGFRDPFAEEGDDVIKSLVSSASGIHRQPPVEEKPEEVEDAGRKRPRYPSEVKRAKRKITLDLDPETKQDLRDVAQEVASIKHLSAISQALIDYALQAYRSGQIEVQAKINGTDITFEAIDKEGSEW